MRLLDPFANFLYCDSLSISLCAHTMCASWCCVCTDCSLFILVIDPISAIVDEFNEKKLLDGSFLSEDEKKAVEHYRAVGKTLAVGKTIVDLKRTIHLLVKVSKTAYYALPCIR